MRNLLVVCLLAMIASPAFSTSYYVSAAGNDAASGTSTATAWKTIAKVNSVQFAPGDNLFFRGGDTFYGNIYFDSSDGNSPDAVFTVSSYGTGRATLNAGNSYGIFAYNTQGIRVENLILTGSGMNTNNQDGLSFYADLPGDVKLRGLSFYNLEVKNFGKTGVKIGSWNGNTGYENLVLNSLSVHDNLWDGILVYGYIGFNNYVGYPHKNVTITHCTSWNNPGVPDPNAIRGNGIVLSNTDGGLIEHCVAFNNGAGNIHCGGPGGIWVYDARGVTIQHNESFSNHSTSTCDGLGFDLDGGSIQCVMQYNYSHDNDGGGFLMGQMLNGRPWKNNICRYNVSENDGRHNAAGITLFKEGSTTVMDSCLVHNNTIYITPAPANNSEAAFKITEWYTGINHARVFNNIFVTTGGVPLVDVPAGYSGYFAGNLYWSSGAPFVIRYQGTDYNTLDAWRDATGNERRDATETGIVADPQLAGAGAGGTVYPQAPGELTAYRLTPGSPAIDAGLDLASRFGVDKGPTDYWGAPSLSGSYGDIGANEYAGSTAVYETGGTDYQAPVVFPNPSTGVLNVSGAGKGWLELYNSAGLPVLRRTIQGNLVERVDCSGLPAGVYCLRVAGGGNTHTVRVLLMQ